MIVPLRPHPTGLRPRAAQLGNPPEVQSRVAQRVPALRVLGVAPRGLRERREQAPRVRNPRRVLRTRVEQAAQRVGRDEEAFPRRKTVVEFARPQLVEPRQRISAHALPAVGRADAAPREGEVRVEGKGPLVVRHGRIPIGAAIELLALEERLEGRQRRRAVGREAHQGEVGLVIGDEYFAIQEFTER